MGIDFWDGVLRGGTMVLLALLACNFARGWRASLTARLGTLLCAAALGYLFLPAMPVSALAAWWRVPLHLAGMACPALFWLFAASWFDDGFELRPVHTLAVVGLVGAGAISSYLGFPGQWPRPLMALFWPLPSLLFCALGVIVALRGRDDDLVELRRRARLMLAVAIGLAIMVVVAAELAAPGWPPPGAWRLINSATLLLLTVTVASTLFGWRDASLLIPPAKPAKGAAVAPEVDNSQLLARLSALMRQERLYRQDGLTITAVAARLGVPEYRLRRAINQGLGARNFNAWLNEFRIAETKAALADPDQRDVPILTIALDAGFGSLAPFNRAFRAETGCTPSEYRSRQRAD
ncbi:helix-turn-helix domain-containing protein [Sandarakinorhabdus rubra]|uniref:helix-turn-helix domain-containing protein n=1 Tax=Sandarakinorhabdus rubra TaxID=2672568 RepID=UPI0013DCCDB0|nr:AraC family transcriptional regulator [Sandarakinorhabdus rubra]